MSEPRQEAEEWLDELAGSKRHLLTSALAAAIEVADREPEQWPGVTDTTAPFVTAAEAYQAVRERLRAALSALREDET